MHIDSGHQGDTLSVRALPLVLQPRLCDHISRRNFWYNLITAWARVCMGVWLDKQASSQTHMQPVSDGTQWLGWPGTRVPKGTYQLHSYFGQQTGAGQKWARTCLENLTCHFPPCENTVAAEWVSIKSSRVQPPLSGKGNRPAVSHQEENTCLPEGLPAV